MDGAGIGAVGDCLPVCLGDFHAGDDRQRPLSRHASRHPRERGRVSGKGRRDSNVVALDKTGTVTTGAMDVIGSRIVQRPIGRRYFMCIAAALEQSQRASAGIGDCIGRKKTQVCHRSNNSNHHHSRIRCSWQCERAKHIFWATPKLFSGPQIRLPPSRCATDFQTHRPDAIDRRLAWHGQSIVGSDPPGRPSTLRHARSNCRSAETWECGGS